jgi:hypothetical protein
MQTNGIGTMDASDTYPCCDTCGYVDWNRRTRDGDACPECPDGEDDPQPTRLPGDHHGT